MSRLVLLCLVLATAGCVPGGPESETRRLRSDAEMIAFFGQQRVSFDSLATMLGEDRGITYLDDYGRDAFDHGNFVLRKQYADRTPAGITAERWDAYERLLRRVHVGRFVRNGPTGVRFEQYVAGDHVRGYEYSRGPDRRNVTDQDLLAAGSGSGYRRLGGGWFLFSLRRSGD